MTNIGREYQHIEDLVITRGVEGAHLAASTLNLISKNPTILDYKWDGVASIFWGRHENGSFGLYPKNQWRKGMPLTKPELLKEILTTNLSQGFSVRSELAKRYELLWNKLEKHTPTTFKGFLNGDLLHCSHNPCNLTSIKPNKIVYNTDICTSTLIAVHGIVDSFGVPVSNNIREYCDLLSQNSELYLIPTCHPAGEIRIRTDLIDEVVKCESSIRNITEFSVPKFSTIQTVLYKYSTAYSKTNITIQDWIEQCSLSDFQKNHVKELIKTSDWSKFWQIFTLLQQEKHVILQTLLPNSIQGITAITNNQPGGEGFVLTLADGSLGKLINPEFRKMI